MPLAFPTVLTNPPAAMTFPARPIDIGHVPDALHLVHVIRKTGGDMTSWNWPTMDSLKSSPTAHMHGVPDMSGFGHHR